jgi:sec-independent protein translocase protein TatB
MFGIGMGELLVILALALVLVGPEDLPKVARWLARALRKTRGIIKDFTASVNMREDIAEVKEAGKMLRETVHEINPVAELTDEIEQVKRETREEIQSLTGLPEMLKKDMASVKLEADNETGNN